LDSNELTGRFDIFERDLIVKLQHMLGRVENRLELVIDQKANKEQTSDEIKVKANFSDLQRTRERILQLEL
jgi:hypothetical protein